MKFSAFYMLSGFLVGIASTRITDQGGSWVALVIIGAFAALVGAGFEAGNDR